VYTNENESPVGKDSSLALLNLTPPIYPARTRFYPLEPERIGTPLVESLSSYIAALAREHSCSTSNFVKEEIIPLTQLHLDNSCELSTTSASAKAQFPHWKEVNSFGTITKRVASALEYGTGIKDIHRMTLFSLDGIIAPDLLYPHRRWCPFCLEEFRNGGRVFEPLLWSLSLVSTCSIHEAPLQGSCEQCSRTSSHLQEFSVPGHCPWCGIWEGKSGDYQPEPVNLDLSGNLLKAKIVEEFLGQRFSSSLAIDASILQRNLRRCIEVCTSGRISVFLRACGLSQTTRPRVVGKLVSLQNLVSVAIKLNLSVSQFFARDEVVCEPAWHHAASLIDQSVFSGYPVRPSWLREKLAEAATEIPPPSLQTVAKRNGYTSTTMLRRAAPELCDAIAENYLGSVRSGEQEWTYVSNMSRRIEIQAVLEEELSKDSPRAIGEIAQSLGYAAAQCLRHMAPEMCKKITKKKSDQRASALLQQKSTLSLALKEEPAPNPKELLVRLNLRSLSQLRYVDEDCYKSLWERYKIRLSNERNCIQSLIERCLQQANPRWKNIEHDTGWSRTKIHQYFPDLYEKARAICKEGRDNESKSDLNAAEGHVRDAIAQLRASGIQPSIENVHRAIPKGPYLNGILIARILRKIRQEELLVTTQTAA